MMGNQEIIFNLNGIPEHIVLNRNWDFEKSRNIERAYNLLSNSKLLDKFIYRK